MTFAGFHVDRWKKIKSQKLESQAKSGKYSEVKEDCDLKCIRQGNRCIVLLLLVLTQYARWETMFDLLTVYTPHSLQIHFLWKDLHLVFSLPFHCHLLKLVPHHVILILFPLRLYMLIGF